MSWTRYTLENAAAALAEGVRVGIAMYENTIKPETIFPNRNTMAVGGDRNEARKEYEMNLAKFHTGTSRAPNEALREKKQVEKSWCCGILVCRSKGLQIMISIQSSEELVILQIRLLRDIRTISFKHKIYYLKFYINFEYTLHTYHLIQRTHIYIKLYFSRYRRIEVRLCII